MPFLTLLRPHQSSDALMSPSADFADREMPLSPRSRALKFVKQKLSITKDTRNDRHYHVRCLDSSPPPPLGQALGPSDERIRTQILYDEYDVHDYHHILCDSDDDDGLDDETTPTLASEPESVSLHRVISSDSSESNYCSIDDPSTTGNTEARAVTFPKSRRTSWASLSSLSSLSSDTVSD
ncbi:hypothetical protein ONZ43_g5603 [Nemania bipapillata]|uniref:Uncharacterized protein n=1 Tax=Nemania bipapillata TaxID=110536 RepID=A0ACC2I8M4_9PEZI|nr:hypothetical protein ONZ43_g5603 [Nemania bipapillata]